MGRPRKIRIEPPKPFNFLVSVFKDGKNYIQKEFEFANHAYLYAKKMREQGFSTEFRQLRKVTRILPPLRERYRRKGWAEPVRIVETGEEFPNVEACSQRTGISGYRIRGACNKGRAIDGLHFKWMKK
jgi:hypothetical protein